MQELAKRESLGSSCKSPCMCGQLLRNKLEGRVKMPNKRTADNATSFSATSTKQRRCIRNILGSKLDQVQHSFMVHNARTCHIDNQPFCTFLGHVDNFLVSGRAKSFGKLNVQQPCQCCTRKHQLSDLSPSDRSILRAGRHVHHGDICLVLDDSYLHERLKLQTQPGLDSQILRTLPVIVYPK